MRQDRRARFSSLSRRRQWLHIGCIALIAVALLLGIYMLAQRIEDSAMAVEEPKGSLEGRFDQPVRVEYEGSSYERKQQLTTILLMGIDKEVQPQEETSEFRNGGQADFLLLMVIDRQGRTVSSIHIDRDAMVDITTLGIFGNVSGTRRAQISLQHGFGDGGEQSARLTVDAVSKLFDGIPVDFYIAMNMDAIATLNDVLGGVTVNIEDDFSALDPAMAKGSTLRLNGQQAQYYVRSRMQVGDGSNASRMIRQRTFLTAAGDALAQKFSEGISFAQILLDALEPYIQSDMRRARLINEISSALVYQQLPMLNLLGVHGRGTDGFVEFEVDQRALKQLVLSLFFNKIS